VQYHYFYDCSISKKRHPTTRALGAGDSAAFLSIFLALSFSRFDGKSRPAYLPLTRAIGGLRRVPKYTCRAHCEITEYLRRRLPTLNETTDRDPDVGGTQS
jgi:hypothetical protein